MSTHPSNQSSSGSRSRNAVRSKPNWGQRDGIRSRKFLMPLCLLRTSYAVLGIFINGYGVICQCEPILLVLCTGTRYHKIESGSVGPWRNRGSEAGGWRLEAEGIVTPQYYTTLLRSICQLSEPHDGTAQFKLPQGVKPQIELWRREICLHMLVPMVIPDGARAK